MIILRHKNFSEELKQLISQRQANKAAGIVPTVSASSQLAQMKQNNVNLGAIKDAERTARRETGHQLQDKITQAAQNGNKSQKTKLLNKASNAGVNAGYKEALNRVNNSNQQVVKSNAQAIHNAQQQGMQSVGILGGAKNTWNGMSTVGKVATGAALVGGTMMIANNIRRRREAEERTREAERMARYRY